MAVSWVVKMRKLNHSVPCAFHSCSTFNISALGQQNVVLEQQNIYFAILAKIGQRSATKYSPLESASLREFRCAKVLTIRSDPAALGSIQVSAPRFRFNSSVPKKCIVQCLGREQKHREQSFFLPLHTFSDRHCSGSRRKQDRKEEQANGSSSQQEFPLEEPSTRGRKIERLVLFESAERCFFCVPMCGD